MAKVVLTRKLPAGAMRLLEDAHSDSRISELVVWPKDCAADADWLKDAAKGASGLLVMLNDKCVPLIYTLAFGSAESLNSAQLSNIG